MFIAQAKPISINFVRFWENYGERIIIAGLKIAATIVAYFILKAIFFRVIDRTLNSSLANVGKSMLRARQARVKALQTALKSVVGFVLAVVAVIMIFQEAGLEIGAPLAAAGVAGVAIGFGAQKLVRDVINGFFILMEDQYGVGDFVTIGTVSGVVEDLGMRTTRIRDAAGKLYIISNGDITQVCNASRGKVKIAVDVALNPNTDLDKAQVLLNDLGMRALKEIPHVKDEFRCEGVSNVTSNSVVIKFVGGVSPAHENEVRIALNSEIRKLFINNCIDFA